MNKIDLANKKSRGWFWIASVVLLLTIIFLVYSILRQSLEEIRKVRQAYYEEVANLKKKDLKITIIEGWRREQIAAELERLNITKANDFMAATETLEGYLFPDTYRFFPNSKATDVVNKLTSNFAKKTEGLNVDKKTLILASIVERETSSDEERGKIAGVYQNRLGAGMKLEADPTAQFSRDSKIIESTGTLQNISNLWKPITKEEINSIDSPYNTYKVFDLPPGPICNPGIKSIIAALNPEKHQYLYFFHAADGQLILSRTSKDHNYLKSVYGVKQ